MSRTQGILLICAIALVGAVLAYTALPEPGQHGGARGETAQVHRCDLLVKSRPAMTGRRPLRWRNPSGRTS